MFLVGRPSSFYQRRTFFLCIAKAFWNHRHCRWFSLYKKTPLEQTAAYLRDATPEPTFGSLIGDWTVFGLARSGVKVPANYYETYYKNVTAAVAEAGGRLSETKYTEYSRLVLALAAIGRDPRNVGGYDLLMPLADFDRTTAQGVNGAIFALLALDFGGYEIVENPDTAVQAIREGYGEEILSRQNEDGSYRHSLNGGSDQMNEQALYAQATIQHAETGETTLYDISDVMQ